MAHIVVMVVHTLLETEGSLVNGAILTLPTLDI
jgi:hypothetical protein